MSEVIKKYQQDGIWTMATPRQSCVVPENPLCISTEEEYELNRLSLSVWNATQNLLEMARECPRVYPGVVGAAEKFPEGLTMPPAIRIDTVRTFEGPKIVEVDPVTAISLGETLSLMGIWQSEGYDVPSGLDEAIRSGLIEADYRVAMALPSAKFEYKSELDCLMAALQTVGVEYDDAGMQLSAFNDVAAVRRRINKNGWEYERNPLWGSLVGLANKNNIGALMSGDKIGYPQYVADEYTRDEIGRLDQDVPLVAKPLRGTGSVGVATVRAKDVANMPEGFVYQQRLDVLADDFGVEGEWVSRVSLYAGKYGLLGAQVTARRKEGDFTNVHGQSDAIQTTLAVTGDVA